MRYEWSEIREIVRGLCRKDADTRLTEALAALCAAREITYGLAEVSHPPKCDCYRCKPLAELTKLLEVPSAVEKAYERDLEAQKAGKCDPRIGD